MEFNFSDKRYTLEPRVKLGDQRIYLSEIFSYLNSTEK